MKTPDQKPFPLRVFLDEANETKGSPWLAYPATRQDIPSECTSEYFSLAEHTALLAAVVEERDRYKKALEWYANSENYSCEIGKSTDESAYGNSHMEREACAALLRDGEK